MILVAGVLVGLVGLIILGFSGNERGGRRPRRGRLWLAYLGWLIIVAGIVIAVGGGAFMSR
jgi:hypothetical protein